MLAVASPSCSHIAFFQMSNVSALPTQATPVIQHEDNAGALALGADTGASNNCIDALNIDTTIGIGDSVSCTDRAASKVDPPFPSGSQLMRASANAYYIADSVATGVPTLWRESLVRNGDAAQTNRQELITGVEDMRITYGVDTSSDGVANQYLLANAVAAADWDNVVSVNVTLILRSVRPVYQANRTIRLNFDANNNGTIEDDGSDDYNDRFLRQKVSATIQLRNRG